ncbi:MAG: alpha/beta fold hydrolase [Alcaligenaceae bacterium]|nr:MAG: alpha/beta fold hydrolase [Alcaligenaceae bacterium]
MPFVPSDPYTGERDRKLNYGVAQVLVPKTRARGTIAKSKFWQDRNDPILFKVGYPKEKGVFLNSLAAELKTITDPTKQNVVLVFIHGYNNSFKDAAIRTAQLWADLRLQGVPAFFSWPSRDKTAQYTVDEATVDYSERYLEEFLLSLRDKVGTTQPIHVIAHSMGNRALLRVATKLKGQLQLGQIILAAPDVDADLFEDLASVYPDISVRTTLYVSRSDKANHFSTLLHSLERVGAPPRFARVHRIDTVEVVAKTGLLELGHSDFAEHEQLLDEISDLITTNTKSDKAYLGERMDHSNECATTDSGRTMVSCWRLLIKN